MWTFLTRHAWDPEFRVVTFTRLPQIPRTRSGHFNPPSPGQHNLVILSRILDTPEHKMAILTRNAWAPDHCEVILTRFAQAPGHNEAILTRNAWVPEHCVAFLTCLPQTTRWPFKPAMPGHHSIPAYPRPQEHDLATLTRLTQANTIW